eukprot:gene3663-4575_t
MHVLEAGEAGRPLLLLLHGFPELAYSWRNIMLPLAELGFHVVAPDQRGYGRTHPFVGEVRIGEVEVELDLAELGFAVSLGVIRVTECQMVNQFMGSAKQPPQFTRGYGLVFGQSERKAMSMALVDRALRFADLGEEKNAPAQDEEFVL